MIEQRHLIIGAGPAAQAAVEGMRTVGFEGSITLIGEEEHLPYERPPLSKAMLSGDVATSELMLKPESWYRENDVDWLPGKRVVEVDAQSRLVRLQDGSSITFDKALIATGGSPRKIEALRHERVVFLRKIEDALQLHSLLGSGAQLVIVGGGFIGCEVAATMSRRGVSVTIIEPLAGPMEMALGADISALFRKIHQAAGVRLLLGDSVVKIGDGRGSLVIQTKNEQLLECDVMLLCVGLEPRTELLANSTVKLDRGVCVNSRCQSSVETIYAAGDVAHFDHPIIGEPIRVEHHDNALAQGAIAGRNMAGEALEYCAVPWVWSDQYEHNLQCTGFSRQATHAVIRGDLETNSFCKFLLRDDTLVGAVGLNRGRDIIAARRMIARGARVNLEALVDENQSLKQAIIVETLPGKVAAKA